MATQVLVAPASASPTPRDVVIYKLSETTYYLWAGRAAVGQFNRWYLVFTEGMRQAIDRDVDLWICDDGDEILLRTRCARCLDEDCC
jgi:hypothetical protein